MAGQYGGQCGCGHARGHGCRDALRDGCGWRGEGHILCPPPPPPAYTKGRGDQR